MCHREAAILLPRAAVSTPHTNIGDSEHPGGMKTSCSPAGQYSSQQGQLPPGFWRNVAFKTGKGKNGVVMRNVSLIVVSSSFRKRFALVNCKLWTL